MPPPPSPDLPEDFLAFCAKEGIRTEEYDFLDKLPRYVRIRTVEPRAKGAGGDEADTPQQALLRAFPSAEAVDISVLPPGTMWRLPGEAKLKGTPLYEAGTLAGIDLGSAMAVAALSVQPTDTVLDLCCAPGAKLLMAAEQTRNKVAGVDVDLFRLSTTRSTVERHLKPRRDAARVRLVLCDATEYDPTPALSGPPWWSPDGVTPLVSLNPSRHRKKLAVKYPNHPEHMPPGGVCVYDGWGKGASSVLRYDKVLVDAECTTDGSLRHIEKMLKGGGVRWAEARDDLFDLQCGLLRKGAALVRPGGTVVYSTCSLTRRQNEDVVSAVLAADDTLSLVAAAPPAPAPPHVVSSLLPLTIYYTPSVSACGGLFLAKLVKRAEKVESEKEVEDEQVEPNTKRPRREAPAS